MDSLARDLESAATALDSSRSRIAKRRRQVIAAVKRWKARNPQKVSEQRRRWRERRAAR